MLSIAPNGVSRLTYFNIWRGGPPGHRTNQPTWQMPGNRRPIPPWIYAYNCSRIETGHDVSRGIMRVQAPSTKTTPKPRLFGGFFNSVIYPYPCITLVLNSIRFSLGFSHSWDFWNLTLYFWKTIPTRFKWLRCCCCWWWCVSTICAALFYWFSDGALVQEPTSCQSYAARTKRQTLH